MQQKNKNNNDAEKEDNDGQITNMTHVQTSSTANDNTSANDHYDVDATKITKDK